jgi:hypothetical protein
MKFKMGAAEIKAARKQPGGSNVGKKTFASGKPRTGPYAGPSGGAPKGSYPIPDVGHAKAAIKMSGHAPNPAGIKSAVYRKYPELKPDKKMQMGAKGVVAKPDALKTKSPIKVSPAGEKLKMAEKLYKDNPSKTYADAVERAKSNVKKENMLDKKMCGSKGMKYAEGTKSIKFKKKEMIKRADGSTSQRGLWDNIRANKGSSKKPTPEMLKQERKIKVGK